MSNKHKLAALVFAGLCVFGCAGGTKWLTTWSEPAAATEGPLKKILVIGMSPNAGNRRIFEDTMVANLARQHVGASPSYGVLPDIKVSEDDLRAKVKEGGYDGVIIMRLVGKQDKSEYVPSNVTVTTYGAGAGPYWAGYSGMYGTTYSAGYMKSETVVSIQTKLWSAKGEGKPLWTGVSESVDPTEVAKVSGDVAALVCAELVQLKLI